MTHIGWRLTDILSRSLHPDVREAVMGDLIEAGESGWSAVRAMLGLVARRQSAQGWWWLTAIGLAIPAGLLLMAFSFSVSRPLQKFFGPAIHQATGLTAGAGFWLLLCNLFVLLSWWCTGATFKQSTSRRALHLGVAYATLPCLFCVEHDGVESMARLCLLILLPAAAWSIARGLCLAQIHLRSAVLFAIAATVFTVPAWSSCGTWLPNWALSWPAWYLVATARRQV